MPISIAASLASAPMDRLGQVIDELETAQVDYVHFDIEDGSFVPVMTLGTKIIPDLRRLTKIPFDVHLMMNDPEWILPDLARWDVDRISVHYEACPYPRRTLKQIASLGPKAGLAFNPATPLPELSYLCPYLSFVVILSTEPELPDSPFLPKLLEKVSDGKQDKSLEGIEWVVDGGVNADNIGKIVLAGADTVVVGRSVFKENNIIQNVRRLRAMVK